MAERWNSRAEPLRMTRRVRVAVAVVWVWSAAAASNDFPGGSDAPLPFWLSDAFSILLTPDALERGLDFHDWGLTGRTYHPELINNGDDEAVIANDSYGLTWRKALLTLPRHGGLSAGLGWSSVRFEDGDDSDGLQLLLEGRVGLNHAWSLYGRTRWLPELNESAGRRDLAAGAYEAGIMYRPAENLSLRAGVRAFRIDFTDALSDRGQGVHSGGVFVGGGIRF